jgi:DNA repair and recombination protein RAD54B
MFKPFKPPILKSIEKPASIDLTESDDEPRPFKKRKLLIHVVEDIPPLAKVSASTAVLAPRKPLLVVKNPIELNSTQATTAAGPEGYYIVLW